jgi:hypothetical protein
MEKYFKEEFVTGGINLKETFQNHGKQVHENLYFAGES